ncbi:MAG: hypothetical protein IT423_08725 [Pirellulaceae bacterium]|nr:hypothetical protein [Pirellulaceae bacterium]
MIHSSIDQKRSTLKLAFIVAVILITHWASMHWLATNWLGGEDNLSQTPSTHVPVHATSVHAQSVEATVEDDGWRRTSEGWTLLHMPVATKPEPQLPTEHFSLTQLWPAAWAMSMLMLVLSLPGGSNPRQQQPQP